jgi:dTDP-4-amino-4,6-dideoxygalactose transaminase
MPAARDGPTPGVKPMDKRVPFLDLRITDEAERQDLLEAVDAVFRHGRIVLGPEVAELERQVAARCGRKYGVAVNSGTDALFLALKALGLGPGDEVITTALSWIATTNAIALTGATPVFADIGDDLNIDPDSARKLITPRTKALLPVHYTGKVCRMNELAALATEHGLALVEDAAQAFDASHHGRKAGSFGALACFSMNPMKVFAACGESGMVLTDREGLYELLISLRYNGTVNREECVRVSLNGRPDTLQAAILLRRLARVDALIEKRRQIAAWYNEQLEGVVGTPREEEGERDVYYTYQVRTARRDELKAFLEANGVETKIQHPMLMPQQPAHRNGARGDFPNALRLVKQILCLPAHEKLTRADVDYVAGCVRRFMEGAGACPSSSSPDRKSSRSAPSRRAS